MKVIIVPENLHGYSPKQGHILQPTQDVNGNYIVGTQILDNPIYSDIHEELNQCEQIDFEPIPTEL